MPILIPQVTTTTDTQKWRGLLTEDVRGDTIAGARARKVLLCSRECIVGWIVLAKEVAESGRLERTDRTATEFL